MLHVICFGNLWQGDDGFGIHVWRRLRELRGLPRQVRVFDAGIAGLGAVGYFEGCRKAVIVDALKTCGRVGHVRRVRLDKLDPPGPDVFGPASVRPGGPAHLNPARLTLLDRVRAGPGRGRPRRAQCGARTTEVVSRRRV